MIIQIAKVTNISDVTGCIAVSAHKPEGVAAIALNRRPPGSSALGIERGTETASDAGYGTVALTLAAGTYQLVVIAHNGEGSATITSTEKVTFPNNKVTDTFYYYGDLVVTTEVQSYDLTLTRTAVSWNLHAV